MTQIAIQCEGLGKRYRIGRTKRGDEEHKRASSLLTAPFQYLATTLRPPDEEGILWALRNVSFEVNHGKLIGIIGRNGAGKSTLLKILSRITEPTEGRVIINGRVGSLLEVGTGFHPELTGRENIYLYGAIHGMRHAEIDRKFDQIVTFSGVEKFMDTQIKRYSSGMYVRLAFAVAAHLEPDILMIDEVLTVGDAAFQKKCLGKMEDVTSTGRTVIFVSHNMVALQSLCERAIWLNDGQIVERGETRDVVASYLASNKEDHTQRSWDNFEEAPGNDRVRIHRLSVNTIGASRNGRITMESPIEIAVEYWNLVSGGHMLIGWRFFTDQQQVAFTSVSNETQAGFNGIRMERGLYRSVCKIPANLLNEGGYHLVLFIYQDRGKIIYRMGDALSFDVVNLGTRPGFRYSREPGAVRPLLTWETDFLDPME